MCPRLLGVLIDNEPIGGIVSVGSIGNIKKIRRKKVMVNHMFRQYSKMGFPRLSFYSVYNTVSD